MVCIVKSCMESRFDLLSLGTLSLSKAGTSIRREILKRYTQPLEMHHLTAPVVMKSRNPRILRAVIQESRMFHVDSHRCKSGGSLGDPVAESVLFTTLRLKTRMRLGLLPVQNR